jgi:hypothetical protein
MTNDLIISFGYDDMRLEISHEGKAGDLALLQASLLQAAETWRDMVSQAFFLENLDSNSTETVITTENEDTPDDLQ